MPFSLGADMLNQVQLTVILWYIEGGMVIAIDEMLQFGLLIHHVRMWCNLLMRVFYFHLGNDLFLSRPQLTPLGSTTYVCAQ